MRDSSFGEIEFNVDAWDGLVPFAFGPSGTSGFAVHVWAGRSGPSEIQRATFDQLKARYPVLWPSIAEALFRVKRSGSIETLADSLEPTVGCYIEREGGGVHADFELVYAFNTPDEEGRGYFVRVVDWSISEVVVAE